MSETISSNLTIDFKQDQRVLLVNVSGPLSATDFDQLAKQVDPVVEGSGSLNGLVIRTRKFPGWENFSSAIRHFAFVKNHHKKIQRVALASDTIMPDTIPTLVDHFTQAEVRRFNYDELEKAISWAEGEQQAEQSL